MQTRGVSIDRVDVVVSKNDTILQINQTLDKLAERTGLPKEDMIMSAVTSDNPTPVDVRVRNLVQRLDRLER